MGSPQSGPRAALSASRAIGVLNYFTANPRGTFTLSELSAALDVSPASMTAVLRALTDAGYLTRHPRRKIYEIGPALVAAGHAASFRHPVIDLARPEMRRLAADHAGECAGTTIVGKEILMLALEGKPSAHAHEMWLGQRLPFLPPLGQVFLAWNGPDQVEAWLARLSPEIDDRLRAHFMAALAQVRRSGHLVGTRDTTIDRLEELVTSMGRHPLDQSLRDRLHALLVGNAALDHYAKLELDPGTRYPVSIIAAPIFDAEGQVVLAITLFGIVDRTGAQLCAVADDLMAVTKVLTRQIGGRSPDGGGPWTG